MSEIATVAWLASALGVVSTALFVPSILPKVVTGSRWLAVAVVIVMGALWAVTWFVAQASPAQPGVLSTLAITAVAVAGATGGGPVATAALRLTDRRHDVAESRAEAASPDGEPASLATPDLLRGGAVVGLLERACVLALLLIGFSEGIAIVLGVKGVGRFGDLRSSPASERFIIGTLASVFWALLAYGAIRAVLT